MLSCIQKNGGRIKRIIIPHSTLQINCRMKLESFCPEGNNPKQQANQSYPLILAAIAILFPQTLVRRQFSTTARRFLRKRVETIAKANDKKGNETKTFQFNIGCRGKNKKNKIMGYFICVSFVASQLPLPKLFVCWL
jgi:hypothetical protein